MNWKELATLKNSYDRRKELLEFQKMLKEKPLQEQEYRSLIKESNLEPQEKIKYYNHIKALRKSDMVIDDVKETYEDFTNKMEKEGLVPIKKSVMKQMSNDEFGKLTTKRIAVFDDLNGSEVMNHYRYRDKSGFIRTTGEGQSVKHIDTNDIDTIHQAQKTYQRAKNDIGKILEEIDVNGSKYQDFMKPKEKANI